MDKNDTIIDISKFLDSSPKEEKEAVKKPSSQTNPIFKKFLVIHNKKIEQKFSLKDLFR